MSHAQKNHLVICGWKSQMSAIVGGILQSNPQWSAKDICIIAPITAQQKNQFLEENLWQAMHIITEDIFSEHALKQCNLMEAAKVLVLATHIHGNESPAEVDANSVIAAMTIEKIAHDVYQTVEILDPDFLPYLKMAHVDEIIFSQEYDKSLFANAMHSSGVAHVLYDLLNVHSNAELITEEIPKEFIGQPYENLWQYFFEKNTICVGLLENHANVIELKKQALTEAQKSTNLKEVIKNLDFVKRIEANLPHMNPKATYQILPNSAVILVRQKESHQNQPLRLVP